MTAWALVYPTLMLVRPNRRAKLTQCVGLLLGQQYLPPAGEMFAVSGSQPQGSSRLSSASDLRLLSSHSQTALLRAVARKAKRPQAADLWSRPHIRWDAHRNPGFLAGTPLKSPNVSCSWPPDHRIYPPVTGLQLLPGRVMVYCTSGCDNCWSSLASLLRLLLVAAH